LPQRRCSRCAREFACGHSRHALTPLLAAQAFAIWLEAQWATDTSTQLFVAVVITILGSLLGLLARGKNERDKLAQTLRAQPFLHQALEQEMELRKQGPLYSPPGSL
jgi:hypothetical protein